MEIPNEISHLYDNYRIDSQYRVCRFCFNIIYSKDLPKESIRKYLTQLVVEETTVELTEITMLKILCCGCSTRLAILDTSKLALEKFENDRQALKILHIIGDQQYSTRSIVGCKEDNRCHVC